MSRKQNNSRRGGESVGHRRFGGTVSLGNYNRSGNHHDGHEENRRSGSWGSNNFNRPYDCSGNHNNFNQQLNNQGNGFQKFRDPHALEQHNNMRSQNNSQERSGRNRNKRGGKQHYRNDRKKGANWYEDRRNVPLQQTDEPDLDYLSVPPLQVSATSTLPQTIPIVTTSPTVSTTLQLPNHDEVAKDTTLEDQKHIIKNIKQEKPEEKKDNPIGKQTKQSESSSSSSESSESENETEMNKKEPNLVKTKTMKIKQESLETQTQKTNTKPSNSSSSSSSSSSEEEDDKISQINKSNKSNTVLEKGPKIVKKQSHKNHSSEEDLICLGKLEKNFIIEDDVSEETEVPKQIGTGTKKNQCLICDNQGHTAFECQMICKNCSAPYHNMKNCPKPANLNTMLKSFMEFCIGQMNQYNPENKFTIPTNICVNNSPLTKNNLLITSTEQNKMFKKQRAKSRDSVKKLTKRKHRHASSDDEDDDEEYKAEVETSGSESESDSSEEVKTKKRRTKAPTPMKTSNFHNTFVPPFSSFPAFGAAAAAYNPLLLSQLMNSGGFGAEKLKFQ